MTLLLEWARKKLGLLLKVEVYFRGRQEKLDCLSQADIPSGGGREKTGLIYCEWKFISEVGTGRQEKLDYL